MRYFTESRKTPLLGTEPLASLEGHRRGVAGGGERALPDRVVAARRVVEEVEVEDEAAVDQPEVGPLRRVDEVAPRAIGRGPGRAVLDRDEQPAGVLVEPPDVERHAEVGDLHDADEPLADLAVARGGRRAQLLAL